MGDIISSSFSEVKYWNGVKGQLTFWNV